MSLGLLTQKSLSLFSAIGGWRTVAESIASRALFLVAYLVTGNVLMSALLTVGGVFVFAVVRLCTGAKVWQPVIGLAVVGVSALAAGSSGQAVDFYLPSIVLQAGGCLLFMMSIVVRWPIVGLVVGTVRGQNLAWRQDCGQRRRYSFCTAVFMAKFAIATAVLVPLYLAGSVVSLGIVATLLGGAPAAGVCAYLCWRILRKDLATGAVEFRVHAFSRPAEIPNPVVRLGFLLFGRGVQLRFIRSACRRVRVLTGSAALPAARSRRP